MMRTPATGLVAGLAIAASALPARAGAPAPAPGAGSAIVERARVLMGTVLRARVAAVSTDAGAQALGAAFDEVARLEAVMSSWRGDSEVARLNAADTSRFALSADLAAVLDSSLACAEATGGAFDPTLEPLAEAWDLRGAGRVPEAAVLAAARARTGWQALALDRAERTARFQRAGMGVDLGGIGKGYALDRMAAVLEGRGVTRGWLDFGGQVRVIGGGATVSPRLEGAETATGRGPEHGAHDAVPRFAIAHPGDRERACVTLPLEAGSAATSAQTERTFRSGGRRFGHVLDPRSGEPVPGRAAVTVVAASGTRADALSTALLVMGREGAERFAASHRDVGVLWLEPAGPTVRAWCWNLEQVAAADGAAVRWMTPEPAPELTLRTKGTP